jgi:hypothetical protein
MDDGSAKELSFRSGRVAFLWEEDSSWIRLVTCDADGAPLVAALDAPLLVEAPPGLRQESEAFTLWCCEYLGILLADKPTFRVEGDPVRRDEETFAVVLSGPIEDLPTLGVLAPVPEASP